MTDKKTANGKIPSGHHPNSLANLKSWKDSGAAEAARLKGLETRRRNKEEREAMKHAVAAFKDLGQADLPPAVEVLRIAMTKAIAASDMDEATRLAALIAPYETPKLASQEITQNVTMTEQSDEELASLAKELGVDLPSDDKRH